MKLFFMKLFLIVSSLALLMTSKTLAYDEVDPAAPLPILKDAREKAEPIYEVLVTVFKALSSGTFWCCVLVIAIMIAVVVFILLLYRCLKNR